MNLLDDIRADGRSEDGGQGVSSTRGLTLGRGDGDRWSGRHCCRQVRYVVLVDVEVEVRVLRLRD